MAVYIDDSLPVVKYNGMNIRAGETAVSGGAKGLLFGSTTTNSIGIYWGTGTPTVAAPKGSLYLNVAGDGVATRLFVCSVATGTWVAVTTAS